MAQHTRAFAPLRHCDRAARPVPRLSGVTPEPQKLVSGAGVEISVVYSSKYAALALEARLVGYHGTQIFEVGGRCGQVEKVG